MAEKNIGVESPTLYNPDDVQYEGPRVISRFAPPLDHSKFAIIKINQEFVYTDKERKDSIEVDASFVVADKETGEYVAKLSDKPLYDPRYEGEDKKELDLPFFMMDPNQYQKISGWSEAFAGKKLTNEEAKFLVDAGKGDTISKVGSSYRKKPAYDISKYRDIVDRAGSGEFDLSELDDIYMPEGSKGTTIKKYEDPTKNTLVDEILMERDPLFHLEKLTNEKLELLSPEFGHPKAESKVEDWARAASRLGMGRDPLLDSTKNIQTLDEILYEENIMNQTEILKQARDRINVRLNTSEEELLNKTQEEILMRKEREDEFGGGGL